MAMANAVCAAGAAMQQHYGVSATSGNSDTVNGVCTAAGLFSEADSTLAGTSGTGLNRISIYNDIHLLSFSKTVLLSSFSFSGHLSIFYFFN